MRHFFKVVWFVISFMLVILSSQLHCLKCNASEIPILEVREAASEMILPLLEANHVECDSKEFSLKNYIPEYILEGNVLKPLPVYHYPIYIDKSIVAILTGIGENNSEGFAYSASINYVNIFEISQKYFKAGIVFRTEDDCYLTDGITFISVISGEIFKIEDDSPEYWKNVSQLIAALDMNNLMIEGGSGRQSVQNIEDANLKRVLFDLPRYFQGNKKICWAAAAWSIGSYLTKQTSPSPDEIAIKIKGNTDTGGSGNDEIEALSCFSYNNSIFKVNGESVNGYPIDKIINLLDCEIPILGRLHQSETSRKIAHDSKNVGHAVAICGYVYNGNLTELYAQDSAFNKVVILRPNISGVFSYFEFEETVYDLYAVIYPTGFQSNDGGNTWYYIASDSVTRCSGWKSYEGNYYFFDSSSHLQRGWLHESEGWYYLGSTGAMQKGWVFVDGKWYFLQDNGLMAYSQWFKWNGVWYYLNSDGSAQTGWKEIEGSYYFFNDSAKMQTGWVNDRGYWFYLDSSGKMLTGFQTINGYKYYFADNGSMALGWFRVGFPWYYADSNGVIQTGWQYIKGEWYYFNYTGTMHLGRLIDGGYIFHLDESSGAMQIGWFATLEGKLFFRTEKNVPYGGPKGSMVVGQKARIDGVVYEFDQKGIARKVLNPNIIPVSVPATDLSEVTDDAA